MTRATKILAIFNIATVLAIWIPLLWINERGLFYDILQAFYIIGVLFALQGLLIFFHPLSKWDLVSAGTIAVTATYCGIGLVLEWVQVAAYLFPIIIFFLLQLQRSKLSDNFRILYLNIWNTILLLFILLLYLNEIH